MRTAEPSRGEDKVLERREAAVEFVDPLLHLIGGREGGR